MSNILEIMNRLRTDFPRKKAAFEAVMREGGLQHTINQRVDKAIDVSDLPTFKNGVKQPLSPMLAARFKYAGSWHEGTDIWLGATEMEARMKSEAVLRTHDSFRREWENSAPMLYPDELLTLFGVTEHVPENIIYLVWSGSSEPQVWAYVGMDETRHANVAEFLEAQIQP